MDGPSCIPMFIYIPSVTLSPDHPAVSLNLYFWLACLPVTQEETAQRHMAQKRVLLLCHARRAVTNSLLQISYPTNRAVSINFFFVFFFCVSLFLSPHHCTTHNPLSSHSHELTYHAPLAQLTLTHSHTL